jgi:hypothetical protein
MVAEHSIDWFSEMSPLGYPSKLLEWPKNLSAIVASEDTEIVLHVAKLDEALHGDLIHVR